MNVLLIDDHEIVWNGTRRLIERVANEVEPGVRFGFDAVRDVAGALALSAHAFGLVLLDYHLPDLSGLAALAAVKAHFETTPMIRGMPVKPISRQLSIDEGMVKVHLSMVYRALGARNRTDALCRVFEAQAASVLEQP